MRKTSALVIVETPFREEAGVTQTVPEEQDQPMYSIGAVARMLGIPASTLRAWEERYAVVTPGRSEGSQRLYSRAHVEKLKFVKAQIEAGMSAADAHRVLSDSIRAGHLPVDTSEPADAGRPVIMIAERDRYAADLVEYFLRTEGFEVVTALDAEQARLQVEERSPDIVVLDLLLSGGAGFRLLGEFAAREGLQVIAVSAIDSAEEAVRGGAAAFMRKPIEPLTLVSTVRDLLGTSALTEGSSRSPVHR
jgi:DNA-binding transcriptional MerR regulator